MMTKHLFRKFFGLTVLYIIIIFGIFAIQFRKEMSIFQNFQSLNLRLSANESEVADEPTTLSNNFRVSGNGLVILASDSNPIILQEENGNEVPLVLENWQEDSENSFTLLFSEDVSLSFHADEAGFALTTQIPNDSDTLVIPYETESAYNITDILKNKIIIKSKDKAFSLLAGNVTTNTISFSAMSNTIAQISPYEETQAFAFSAIVGIEQASTNALNDAINQAKAHIVRLFESGQADTANEKFVAAYVAELALQGRYTDAIANVPDSFKNGNNRTYFTAPYFNTLVAMNQTLLQQNENISFSMQYSLERSILDVYELDTFPSFLLQQKTTDIEPILALPAQMENFAPSAQQAAGILDVYVTLAKYLPSLAALLSPVLDTCIDVLQSATTLNGTLLNITSDEGMIDKMFAVKAGSVLQKYGNIASRLEVTAGGTMLVVSALQNISTLTSGILGYMYPYIINDNPYYPHADVLGYNNGTPIWIWNIIPVKDYTVDSLGTITMHFDFPVTEIYHSIITGIEPFEDIEIYGLNYATDARFETYNAPGYVYQDENKTLLLRYRQRSEIEEMKLVYATTPTEAIESISTSTDEVTSQAAGTSEPL